MRFYCISLQLHENIYNRMHVQPCSSSESQKDIFSLSSHSCSFLSFIQPTMRLSTTTAVFTITACEITQVLAHGGVLSYNIGGQVYQGFVFPSFTLIPFYLPTPSFKSYNTPVGQSTIQREWDSYDPIIDPTHAQLSCNINGANLGSGQLSATVPAGSKVLAWWNQWPHSLGPVMVYMANCNGPCTSANTASLNWVSVDFKGNRSREIN